MAEMEKNHDLDDMFALLVPEQHRAPRTFRLHFSLCRGAQDLASRSIAAGVLSEPSVRVRYLDHRTLIPQDRKKTSDARVHARILSWFDRLQSVHQLWCFDGLPHHTYFRQRCLRGAARTTC